MKAEKLTEKPSHSAIKKNTFESVLMRWMKLEPIIKSEARKKNTNTVY